MRSLMSLTIAIALTVAAQVAPAGTGDIGRGMALFKQRCSMCHAAAPQAPPGIGPNLFGVVGCRIGTTGFNYSPAFKKADIVWLPAQLDQFLTSPARKVPGTRMFLANPDPKDRADLIAYLASTGTQSGSHCTRMAP